MKVSDTILGPVVVVIGLVALYASSLQPRPFFGAAYGGGFFPSVVAVGLIGAGALLTLVGWRARAGQPLVAFGPWIRSPRHLGNVAVVLGSLVFYILASNRLGFVIAGFVVVFATMLQFSRAPVRSFMIAAATIVVGKFLFQDMLRVPLPWGVLEPWSGVLRWR